jgi:hypothetical protein
MYTSDDIHGGDLSHVHTTSTLLTDRSFMPRDHEADFAQAHAPATFPTSLFSMVKEGTSSHTNAMGSMPEVCTPLPLNSRER